MAGLLHLCPRNKDVKADNKCHVCGCFVCNGHAKKNITYTCSVCPVQCQDADDELSD